MGLLRSRQIRGGKAPVMEMEFSTREKLVGTFLILTMLLISVSLIVIGRGKAWFSEHASYHIEFDEGYNLTEGAMVKILNTDVGWVTSIRITPRHKVGVDIEILKKYSELIRKDSVAVVDSPTVIGSEFISISAGSTNLPLISDKGLIPSKRKKSLSDYADEFHLEEKFNALAKILYGVEQTVDQLKDPAGPLLGTLWDIRTITNRLKDGHGAGRLLVEDDLYERLDEQMAHLETILANFEKTSKEVEQTSQSLPTAVQEIHKILADIKATTENIRAASQDIKAAAKDAPMVTRSARDNLHQLDKILDSAMRSPLIKGGIPEKGSGVVQPEIRGAR